MNIEYLQERDKRMELEAKILQFRKRLRDAAVVQTLDGEIAEDWLKEYDKYFGIVAVREGTVLDTIAQWAKTYKVDPELMELNRINISPSSPGGESTITNGENNTDEGFPKIPHI